MELQVRGFHYKALIKKIAHSQWAIRTNLLFYSSMKHLFLLFLDLDFNPIRQERLPLHDNLVP